MRSQEDHLQSKLARPVFNVDTKQVESGPVCEIMYGTAAKPMQSPCEALEFAKLAGLAGLMKLMRSQFFFLVFEAFFFF